MSHCLSDRTQANVYFSASFDAEQVLQNGPDQDVECKFSTIDEFEQQLIDKFPEIVMEMVAIDENQKPNEEKTKSKKQMKREREERLKEMCAKKGRTVLERKPKKPKPVKPFVKLQFVE